MDSEKQKVIIVGAGFSGLVTGFYLVEKGYRAVFYEKSERAGGLLGSHKTQHGIVEQAANAFIANEELERISEIIGIKLYEIKSTARKRYIFRKSQFCRWPLGLGATFWVFCFLIRYIFQKKSLRPQPGQSLQEWGEKRLGREATDILLSTVTQGIYATTASELSASLILQGLFSKERAPKGKLKGSVAAAQGMSEWVRGMKSYLEKNDCEFKFSCSWQREPQRTPVVLATGLSSVKEILKNIGDSRFERLKEVPALSITSMSVYLDKKSDALKPGFGCLFPQAENSNALGVLSNRDIFEGRVMDCLSETWIFNDSKQPVSKLSQEKVLELIVQDRQKMGLRRSEVIGAQCFQWAQTIPHYGSHLENILPDLDLEENNIFLMGNYLGQLGLSRIIGVASKVADLVSEKGQWAK